MTQALARLRRQLWQPALAGSYLQRPTAMFDQAVSLAASNDAISDALYFIEESKAHPVTDLSQDSAGR